jgi:ribosomal protein S18 acetylase RimI-like enzyme
MTTQAVPQRYVLRPVDREDPAALVAVLEVYRQCEDFLAIGPQPHASLEMVLADLQLSHDLGSLFCGISLCPSDELAGVIDYLPAGFEGNPQHAFLELLMIARPFRGQGLGRQVVASVETEVCKNPRVTAMRLGCQVNNPTGLRFWKSCGYRIIRPPKLFPDQTVGCLMEKQF